MGVVEKVQLTRTIPETLAAPSNGIDAATVAIVAEKGGLTIVTKRSGRRNRIVGQNKRKFGKLRRQTEELAAARDRVRHTMQLEEDKGQKMVPCVVDWMYSVEEFIERVNTFLDGECQSKTKSLQGWLAKTLVNPLSKKARKLEQEVVELYAKRDFPAVSYSPQLEQMVVELYAKRDLPAVSYSSRTPILKSIMDELRNPGTNIILVHGSGGVGKTTLIKEVFRQTRDDNYFDDVVMVLDVKNYPSLERIQTEILEKLGVDIIGEEPMARRACRLIERIKGEKILVILDDVSEIIDLEAIGLHCAENCRILLTSRTTLVLSGVMGMQKDFALDVLSEEESWSLFEKIAGDVVRQDDVRSTAIQVAKECGGLPLAIVSVARALKGQSTLHVWKDALRRFDRANETDHLEQIYSALELSYNYLNDELQQFFLLCGITAARSTDSVVLGDLLKYVMGLGLFKNIDTVEEACDALHSLVSKLKDHCLLLDSYDGTRVRMHDLVRDFSAMVAFRDHHVLSVAHGAELVEWPDMAFFQKCTMIILPSCKIPRLPSVPWECPQLKMFTLRGANHDLLEIPLHFFEEMKVLKVLDLTNLCIPSLPASLQFLRNLQTLCLDQCVLADIAMLGQLRSLEVLSFFNSQFKQLPREIAELTCLRLLDLTDCSELETIPPNVISSLTRLEDLRMRNSFNHWEAEQVIGERSNASLSELKYLSQLTALDVHIPDDNMLPANIFSSNLNRYHIIIGGEWTWHNVDETVNTVKLKLTPSNDQLDLKILLKRTEVWHLDMLEGVDYIVNQFDNEDFQQLKHLHVQNSAYAGSTLKNEMDSLVQHFMIEKVTLPNLMSLALYQCGGSRFLLSSSMARSLVQLKHLQISRCGTLEDMVSTSVLKRQAYLNAFLREP